MKHNLSDRYKTSGVVKPGANITMLVVSVKTDISKSAVFWGGANDVSNNNIQEGLKHIVNFVQTNRHTNIIVVSVPYQYDLPDWSCVNYEVETFSRKLMKLVKPFKHVKVVEVEFYTKHGHHTKNMGKEKVAVKTAQAVTTILQEQKREQISLYWKTDQEDKGSQATRGEKTFIREDLKVTVLDKKVVTPNVQFMGNQQRK
jgi:hypothetical protein